MKKISVILILALVLVPLSSLRAFALADFGPLSEQLEGVQPSPTLEPMPSEEPLPTDQPMPSIAPRPEYAFAGPDEDGLWHSGYVSYAELSQEEIRELFASADTEVSQPRFDVLPETQNEPYAAGQLTRENLERTRDYANVFRRLAGLNSLELSDEANMYAQYGAWLLCHNQAMSHTPPYDPTIPSEFYQNGYTGCSQGNISRTYSIDGFLKIQTDGYLNEYQANNVQSVGHRQHFLDPRLEDYGFGSAGLYHTMFVGHKSVSAEADDYDFIAWPSSGNFPADTDAFTLLSPWSISFSKLAVRRPATGDALTVTVEHNGEIVDTLVYGTDPGSPGEIFSPAPYITVNSQYTNNHCIIFRPDLTATDRLEGEYTVTVSNLHTVRSGAPLTVRYRVVFFDLEPEEAAAEPVPSPTLGDVDGDGSITIADALLVVRYSMGLAGLDEIARVCADADENGTIDMFDSLMILRMAMGVTYRS